MTVRDEIFRLALELCPEASESDQRVLIALCSAAESSLKMQLRSGVRIADCEDCFCVACAWIAVDALRSGGMNGIQSFTAGNITINRSEGNADGRKRAMQLMAPFLRDGSAFLGVRG